MGKVETKPVTDGDTQNPFWGETHTWGPWHEGEPLEFTVYDKSLIGSKTEGKIVLGPELLPEWLQWHAFHFRIAACYAPRHRPTFGPYCSREHCRGDFDHRWHH